MYLPVLRQISRSLKTLNPTEVRAMADRPIQFGVLAADDQVAAEIFNFLLPAELSEARAREAGKRIVRIVSEDDFGQCNLGFAEPGHVQLGRGARLCTRVVGHEPARPPHAVGVLRAASAVHAPGCSDAPSTVDACHCHCCA